MSEMDEKYFVAKITIDMVDAESGKVKKQKEEKLVRGYSPTDVEAKITKIFEAYTQDWRITAIVESKIDEVIEESKFSIILKGGILFPSFFVFSIFILI